jgi:hypothetical protein
MNFPSERAIRSTTVSLALVSFVLATPALDAPARAQSLPTFERFPTDAPGRLAHAVLERLEIVRNAPADTHFLSISRDQLMRPDRRRSLWESIEGALGSQPFAGTASPSPRPTSLVDVLDTAIGAYMTELGRIALEIDQQGGHDAVTRLAPLHPGEQGSGSIDVGDVGTFRELLVNFRGEIAHPDGRTPAVVAQFYLLPDRVGPPIAGRLVIPTAGAEPSFRAEVSGPSGVRETRDYGWRPRLSRLGSILELKINGQWARVEDELDAPMAQRRPGRDATDFCDASCNGN